MGYNKIRVDHYNRILRLDSDEINNPAEVVAEFFTNYHLHETREILWEWLWTGLANSQHIFPTAMDRSNLLFFYENLEKLLEANYVMKKRAERKVAKGKRKRQRKGAASPIPISK